MDNSAMRMLSLIIVSIVIAGLALDGASFFATGKGVSGRVLSLAMRQDCGTWRLLTDPNVDALCRGGHDDTATAVAVVSGEDAGKAPGSATVPPVAPPAPSNIDSANGADYRSDAVIVEAEPLADIDLEQSGVAEAGTPTNMATLADAEAPTGSAPNMGPLPTAAPPAPSDIDSAYGAHYRSNAVIVEAEPLADIDLEQSGVAEAGTPTDMATLADAEAPTDSAPNVGPLPTVTSPTTDGLAVTPAAVPALAGNRKATYLVVGSFHRMRTADRLAERLIDVPTAVTPAVVDEKVFFRVVTGPFAKDEMDTVHGQFAALGIGDFWAISLCTADLSAPPCVAR